MEPEETWAAGQTVQDGKPMVVRVNVVLHAVGPLPQFPIEVVITARFEEPDARGLPGPAESAALDAFEAFAVQALSKDDLSKFAAVVTYDGMRDYFFYSRSDPVVADRLKAVVDHRGSAMTGASAQEEPEWATLRSFAEGIVGG